MQRSEEGKYILNFNHFTQSIYLKSTFILLDSCSASFSASGCDSQWPPCCFPLMMMMMMMMIHTYCGPHIISSSGENVFCWEDSVISRCLIVSLLFHFIFRLRTPIGWVCWIRCLLLCWKLSYLLNECLGYDIKMHLSPGVPANVEYTFMAFTVAASLQRSKTFPLWMSWIWYVTASEAKSLRRI